MSVFVRIMRFVRRGWVISLAFFSLYYLYLWRVVDLRLIYHGGGTIVNFPVFFRGWEFFEEFLRSPGGPSKYVSAFLAQFFSIGWAGAIIATVQAWLLCICTGYIVGKISGWRVRWVSFVPAILLLIPFGRYSYQFDFSTALIVVLIFVCFYLMMASKHRLLSMVTFLILSVILCPLAGGAFLLFGLLCAIYEILERHRWITGIVYLVATIVVCHFECLLIFDTGIFDTFGYFQSYSDMTENGMTKTLQLLYLFVPVIVVSLKILRLSGVNGILTEGSGNKAEDNQRSIFSHNGARAVVDVVSFILPFVIGILVGIYTYDAKRKTIIEVDYYASRRMWPEVLKAASRDPRSDYTGHSVNRALYHMGRLADDMFSYSQGPGCFILSSEGGWAVYWKMFDTYLDLGHVNMAEYLLGTSVETYGEQPILLKRLALVNMAKGNMEAARIYLRSLSRTLFDGDWAERYLEKMDTDPNLSADEEVQRLRSLTPQENRVFREIDENAFEALLERNKRNRMAFEYLMGECLLKRQLDKLTKNMVRLGDFGYSRIPRSYEEGVLLYSIKEKKNPDLGNYEISPETRMRVEHFMSVLFGRYRGNWDLALNELEHCCSDSYPFYYFYGQSGIKQ